MGDWMVRPVQGNSPEQKAMERSYSGPKCGGLRAALPVSPIWIWTWKSNMISQTMDQMNTTKWIHCCPTPSIGCSIGVEVASWTGCWRREGTSPTCLGGSNQKSTRGRGYFTASSGQETQCSFLGDGDTPWWLLKKSSLLCFAFIWPMKTRRGEKQSANVQSANRLAHTDFSEFFRGHVFVELDVRFEYEGEPIIQSHSLSLYFTYYVYFIMLYFTYIHTKLMFWENC